MAGNRPSSTQGREGEPTGARAGSGGGTAVATDPPWRRPASDYWHHDPRLDPPTKKDRRRLLAWVALMGFTPICLGVVVWAALRLNGNYPTVTPPIPPGWQSVPGIYASFSTPKDWSLVQYMSDSAADIYYSGRGGNAGESVTEAGTPPRPTVLPTIVSTFLVDPYKVTSRTVYRLHNATDAWKYTFALSGGGSGLGVLAWVASTQSQVWLILTPASPTTDKVLSTLTLAS